MIFLIHVGKYTRAFKGGAVHFSPKGDGELIPAAVITHQAIDVPEKKCHFLGFSPTSPTTWRVTQGPGSRGEGVGPAEYPWQPNQDL